LSATPVAASRQDLPEILEIYNEVIRTSTAVYTEIEFSAERGAVWFDAKLAGGFPFIVAKDASGVMIAGIDADNAVSIRLHESLGFIKGIFMKWDSNSAAGLTWYSWSVAFLLQSRSQVSNRRLNQQAALARSAVLIS
jgi:L-amino acid N-acyltransferase YncA